MSCLFLTKQTLNYFQFQWNLNHSRALKKLNISSFGLQTIGSAVWPQLILKVPEKFERFDDLFVLFKKNRQKVSRSFNVILYHLIALKKLYILFFESENIRRIIWPEMDENESDRWRSAPSRSICGRIFHGIELQSKDFRQSISRCLTWSIFIEIWIEEFKLFAIYRHQPVLSFHSNWANIEIWRNKRQANTSLMASNSSQYWAVDPCSIDSSTFYWWAVNLFDFGATRSAAFSQFSKQIKLGDHFGSFLTIFIFLLIFLFRIKMRNRETE